jgi:hypothetical protein
MVNESVVWKLLQAALEQNELHLRLRDRRMHPIACINSAWLALSEWIIDLHPPIRIEEPAEMVRHISWMHNGGARR